MCDATRRQACRPRPRRAIWAGKALSIVIALTLLPAFAAAPNARGSAQRSAHLASMQIEIWPEFDRPAALVLLKGTLAADAPLPADVRLRIPAASGGPSAVAYSNAAGGELLNLEYERIDASDFITLHFQVPQRVFRVEFYDPLASAAPERSYGYVWPGDVAVDALRVIAQEPAGAGEFSAQPALDAVATGPDGLRYHSAELGAYAAGKRLAIKLRYRKSDTRTSTELLRPAAQNSTPITTTADAEGELPSWVLALVTAASLLFGIATAVLWWRRSKAPR